MPYRETAPFSLTFRLSPALSLFLSCAFSARRLPFAFLPFPVYVGRNE
jgi:hypothetical protein